MRPCWLGLGRLACVSQEAEGFYGFCGRLIDASTGTMPFYREAWQLTAHGA
jgi:hypothetical protein